MKRLTTTRHVTSPSASQVSSEYDTWNTAVVTHHESGHRYIVNWTYEVHPIRHDVACRIDSVRETFGSALDWSGWVRVDIHRDDLMLWTDVWYTTPDELLTAAEQMVLYLNQVAS